MRPTFKIWPNWPASVRPIWDIPCFPVGPPNPAPEGCLSSSSLSHSGVPNKGGCGEVHCFGAWGRAGVGRRGKGKEDGKKMVSSTSLQSHSWCVPLLATESHHIAKLQFMKCGFTARQMYFWTRATVDIMLWVVVPLLVFQWALSERPLGGSFFQFDDRGLNGLEMARKSRCASSWTTPETAEFGSTFSFIGHGWHLAWYMWNEFLDMVFGFQSLAIFTATPRKHA